MLTSLGEAGALFTPLSKLPSFEVIDGVASLVEEKLWGKLNLPSLGERLRVGELRSGMRSEVGSSPLERGWVFVEGYRPGRGIDMPAPGNARGIGCSSNAPLENTLQRTENPLKSCNHLTHNALTPSLLM